VVAAFGHRDITTGVTNHQDAIDVSPFNGERGIDIRLERHNLAATQTLVSGDHEFTSAIFDTASESLWREPAKYDRMDRSNSGAGEHRRHPFNHHRHIERDAIALADTHRLERIGHRDDFAVQIGITEPTARCCRVIRLKDDRSIVASRGKVTVNSIVAKIKRAISKPGNIHRIV